jgi:hypothetical protein
MLKQETVLSLLDEIIKIIVYVLLTIIVLTIQIIIYIRIICNRNNLMCY